MRTLRIATLALPLLALGCRANTNHVLMEQESRLLEDRVYHLQAMLEDCHVAREAAIRENESLKRQLSEGSGNRGYGEPAPATPSRSRPRSEAPKMEAPTIELPESSGAPDVELPPPSGESAAVGTKPTQLVINERLTRGLDRDGQAGDEGVTVFVEPRDADGRVVKAPGAISLVVMDPTQEGTSARVARWDFAAGEVPALFRNNPSARGLQFELPWPNEPPKNRALRLFVRCTTADGTKITSEAPLEIRGPGDSPQLGRADKDRSGTDSASRPTRRRSPSSRLKSSRPEARRDFSQVDGDADSDETAEAEQPSPREPMRQAARSDRPQWKPYR